MRRICAGTVPPQCLSSARTPTRSCPASFPKSDIEKYSRLALGAIRDAGIQHFGVRIHGAGEYPHKLRDADHPIELLYFQGLWDLVNTLCVAVVGTREPTDDGKLRAAKLVRLLGADGAHVSRAHAYGPAVPVAHSASRHS